MVDITLEIMLEPATHDLSYDADKNARRFRRGDIFEVHRTTDIATLDGSGDYRLPSIGTSVFGYIHVKNVPLAAALKIRAALTKDTGETITRSVTDPDTGEVTEVVEPYHSRRRKWRIPRSVIPAAAKTKLLAEREITVEWAVFRDKIRRKIITDRLDPSLDDESNAVSDSDLA